MSEKIEINIDSDAEGSEETADNLETVKEEFDQQLQDRISGRIADEIVKEYIEQLRRNNSVVTGTGIRSIESQKLQTGRYGVFIADYLDAVDEGSSAHHPPTKNNTRLDRAAQSYGMSKYQLAKTIAEKGTQPHPFKRQALDKARNRSMDLANSEIQKVLDRIG